MAETRAAVARRHRAAVGAAADPVAAMAAADVAAVAGAVAGPPAEAAEVDSLFGCPGCLLNRGTLVA